MRPLEEPERPKAVTVIGRLWLVLAALFLFQSIVDLVLWIALEPAMPTILGFAARRDPQARFLEPLFEHYVTVKSLEAAVAVAVGLSAYHFLRLRAWARVAIQAACWLALAYIAGFGVFWFSVWTRTSRDPTASSAHQYGRVSFLAGFGVCLALTAGLIAMIVLLRSEGVRAAFGDEKSPL
jgi:hypothetical protein